MSKPIVIYWPPATTIIKLTTGVTLQGSEIPLQGGSFEYNGLIRSIDIVRSDALAGVQYVITGIGCTCDLSTANVVKPTSAIGPITDTINAAAAGSAASSTKIFKKITSIRVIGGNASDVEIYYGSYGITDYTQFDFNRDALPISTAYLQFISRVGMFGSVYISLNQPESPDSNGKLVPFGYVNGVNVLAPNQFIPIFQLQAPVTADQIVFGPGPPLAYSVIWASVRSCTTDSLFFTFIQAGIR